MQPHLFIRAAAGSVVLLAVALGHFVHPGWLLLAAFAAFNLLQSAFTGFCPPLLLLQRLGWIHRDGLIHPGREKEGRSAAHSTAAHESRTDSVLDQHAPPPP